MTHIHLDSVSLSYPIFCTQARSLKHNLIKMTIGGKVNVLNHSIVIDALTNVSFSLEGGDRLGLIGANGSGKSTLLRVLAKVYKQTSGTAKIHGSISSLLDINLGMDHEANGYENIKIRALLLGIPKTQWPVIIKDVEEFTELNDFLNMPIRTYSAGMLVRLAFALSTMLTPDILLIDELIEAGDSQFKKKAKERMSRIIQKSEILVIATHSMDTIKNFCNKAIWLEHGIIQASGGVDDVIESYAKKS